MVRQSRGRSYNYLRIYSTNRATSPLIDTKQHDYLTIRIIHLTVELMDNSAYYEPGLKRLVA